MEAASKVGCESDIWAFVAMQTKVAKNTPGGPSSHQFSLGGSA